MYNFRICVRLCVCVYVFCVILALYASFISQKVPGYLLIDVSYTGCLHYVAEISVLSSSPKIFLNTEIYHTRKYSSSK